MQPIDDDKVEWVRNPSDLCWSQLLSHALAGVQKCLDCKSRDNDADMICCDLCDDGTEHSLRKCDISLFRQFICCIYPEMFAVYHLQCLDPPLVQAPAGEWHCRSCADAPFQVYTCWIALGNVNFENGVLAMQPRTQTLTGYDLAPKGKQVLFLLMGCGLDVMMSEFVQSSAWPLVDSFCYVY